MLCYVIIQFWIINVKLGSVPPSLRPWSSAGKWRLALSWEWISDRMSDQGRESDIMDRWFCVASAKWPLHQTVVVKRENFQFTTVSTFQLSSVAKSFWVVTKKNEIADTSCWNEIPPTGGWAQPSRYSKKLRHLEGSPELSSSQREDFALRGAGWGGWGFQSGRIPEATVWRSCGARPTGRRPCSKPRKLLRDYIIPRILKTLRGSWGKQTLMTLGKKSVK